VIVVDTHVVIWDALAPHKLSRIAKSAIKNANAEDGIVLADISLWEIGMLMEKGRISINESCQAFLSLLLEVNKCRLQPITVDIAVRATHSALTGLADPADRLIAATSLALDVPLVTADQCLRGHKGLKTIW